MRFSDRIPPRVSDRRLWEIQPLRDLAGIVAIGGTLWMLYDFRRLLAPVLIALVLAYVCDPLLQAAHRKLGMPRWVLALACTISLVTGRRADHGDVARRAYQLYEEGGRRDGSHVRHWLQAEGEVGTRLRGALT